MIVYQLEEKIHEYENFEIWNVENMSAFFEGNAVIKEIFQKEYKIKVEDFDKRRAEMPETNIGIMTNILDHVGDKHFFIFTLNDKNHRELVKMQYNKIMNFGLDIGLIDPSHVYILIMDKIKKSRVGL